MAEGYRKESGREAGALERRHRATDGCATGCDPGPIALAAGIA